MLLSCSVVVGEIKTGPLLAANRELEMLLPALEMVAKVLVSSNLDFASLGTRQKLGESDTGAGSCEAARCIDGEYSGGGSPLLPFASWSLAQKNLCQN